MNELEQSPYPTAGDLGFGESTRQRLANILLGEVELPRYTPEKIKNNDWAAQDHEAYVHWLMGIVAYTGAHSRVNLADVITKASKLGLGPSAHPIYNSGLTINSIVESAGLISRDRFTELTVSELIAEGRVYADSINNRPTRQDIAKLNKAGNFASAYQIKTMLGTFSMFQELVGRPNANLWKPPDYVEWGAMIVRKNPGLFINKQVLNAFSRVGKGPAYNGVYYNMGGLVPFRSQSIALERQRRAAEAQAFKPHLVAAQHALTIDALFNSVVTDNRPTAQLAKEHSYYRIVRNLLVINASYLVGPLVKSKSTTELIAGLQKYDPTITKQVVQDVAYKVQVYVPPQYRFEHVDLEIPKGN